MNSQMHNPGHGSRFAEKDEIINAATKIKCDDDRLDAGGVPLYSDGKTAYVDNQDSHSLIFGATGSMKTRRIIMPTIATLIKHGESIVVHDPKGELYKRFAKLLDRNEYDTHVLNFRDSGKGSRWNPLSTAYAHYLEGNIDKSTESIRDIAECIYGGLSSKTDDIFWANTAIDYFVGLALLLRDVVEEGAFTIENIRLAHSLGDEQNGASRIINEYFNKTDKFSEASVHLSGTVLAPNETRTSIHSVFSQPLSLYLQENLCDMLCESDFSFSSLGRQKTAIFLITPDERSGYNPIITTFIKLCYGCLIDIAHSNGCGETLPLRVNFVIDEFSSLPPISDFNNMISAGRSRNIRFHLVVQNLSQLFRSYTKETAETVITNCGVWLVLRSKDYILHELLGKMCGVYISDYGHVERSLLDTTTVQKLSKTRGEVLILKDGHYPFITELPDIDEYSFNLPTYAKTTFLSRQPKERSLFDIRDALKEKRVLTMNLPAAETAGYQPQITGATQQSCGELNPTRLKEKKKPFTPPVMPSPVPSGGVGSIMQCKDMQICYHHKEVKKQQPPIDVQEQSSLVKFLWP